MSISSPFIKRPVATTLLTCAIALVGFVAYFFLPVAPLPQIDFPTIRVQANLPGASPETMAATVATPLERALGRIAGISEMTSQSNMGTTSITLQFDLDRNIDGAARDVQAAINAARAMLPTMPTNPSYRKMNPADAPIMILGLTSATMPMGEMYDLASSVLAQKVSQIEGVGQVQIAGSSLPAVRVEVDPLPLQQSGLSMENLRTSIARSNANSPKGIVDDGETQWIVGANDKLRHAKDFENVIIRQQDGATLRLGDVARVIDDKQDIRNLGAANGKPAVLLIVFKQAGANIIETVQQVRSSMPLLRAWAPESVDFHVIMDRSPSIKASLHDVELTLVIAVLLVTAVVFLFLRNLRAVIIPAVAVPVSLLGTFAVMYLMGFSLNHLSLMALTIATGFVVDDAIVVTENIVRHVEGGMAPMPAAHLGSREVAFTVISISISLVAIFIPILGMGGLLGRLFKEFAVTLSVAVLVSLVVSLTTTPTMCAYMLRPVDETHSHTGLMHKLAGGILNGWFRFLNTLHKGYAKTLAGVLNHKKITLLVLLATIFFNVFLYIVVPKGVFPVQDTGLILGMLQADQSISFQAMKPKFMKLMDMVRAHPDVASVGGFAGGFQRNSGIMFISLKPRSQRTTTIEGVINDLRGKLLSIPGAQLRLQTLQDLSVGGRRTKATYQYTMQSDNLGDLRHWAPIVAERLKSVPGLIDVNSDQENRGLQTTVFANKDRLAELGVTQRQLDTALSLAFGQGFASTLYTDTSQYRVVLEYDTPYLESTKNLDSVYVPTGGLAAAKAQATSGATTGIGGNAGSSLGAAATGTPLIPLGALATYEPSLTALSVSHQEQMAAATISFNLQPGISLSQVQEKIQDAVFELGLPDTVRGGFQGTAKTFKSSMGNLPLLIAAALITLYIVLGVLYESLIHPLTILSTLPSAGVGAILGLMLFKQEFTIIAFIGVLLLCGIVKKNAIMMVDFAIAARRNEGLDAKTAIYNACLLRFRPIMMTTMAAIFGAIPLMLNFGEGSEMRAPLGITIVGGLIVSQILTLYTTPVVYLYLDRVSKESRAARKKNASHPLGENA
ncbi:efflux RND transporter permease subunit [Desulfovibrio cuneatus]|uniref:efflux RND transporter permease subunit n=1 Tax=Desulfovibrio cuneatus TaxID=159728 RepID=UPI00042608B7|nr:efflux RND transporter permease subunit [Desulfovibrio cuneatus]